MTSNQTKVSKAKPETTSVRTTIPSHIAEKMGLDAGVTLEWDFDKTQDGEWIATIRRVKSE